MTTLATVIGLLSGFALTGYRGDPLTLLVTSCAVNLSLAPVTALIAHRRAYSTWLWLHLGLIFGVWALAAALLLLPPAGAAKLVAANPPVQNPPDAA